MNPIPTVACLTVLTLSVPAQCAYLTASSHPYGAGCSEVFGTHPTLSASIDPQRCALDITVEADHGCCNTFLQGTVLVLGLQPAALPLPLADPTCTLHVQPAQVLTDLTPIVPGTFSLPLPPGPPLPPVTIYTQGVGLYYTTVTFPQPYALQNSLTGGYAIVLQ